MVQSFYSTESNTKDATGSNTKRRCTKPVQIAIVVTAVLLIAGIIIGALAATGTFSSSSSSASAQGSVQSEAPTTSLPQSTEPISFTEVTPPLPSATSPLPTPPSESEIAQMKPRIEVLENLTVSWAEWRAQCGDGVCGEGEWCRTCPQDCPCTAIPGNGVCEDGENGVTDPDDCLKMNSVCGNGICEDWSSMGYHNFYESPYNCPIDCPLEEECGNGICESTESCFRCSVDCGVCAPTCGDGECNESVGETCTTCKRDCGLCEAISNDNICAWPKETSGTTPSDCIPANIQNSVVMPFGVIYATLGETSPEQVPYEDSDCDSTETYLPNGWKIADNNQHSKEVAAAYPFATPCVVLSDGTVLTTKGSNATYCHPVPLVITTHSDRRVSVQFLTELCPARILIEQIDSVLRAPGFTAKACPANCNGHGSCDPINGKCTCDSRYTGTECGRIMGDISIPANLENVERFRPQKGIRWQWQLQDTIDESHDVPLYDVDIDTPASTIASLHAAGRKVMCYFSAGSYEDWRMDRALFPEFIKGGPLMFGEGDVFTDEAWLDIRRIDIIAPIMMDRLDAAKAKGCDALEFDNPDVIIHEHGLEGNIDLTLQLQFDIWGVRQAHARGMSVALKNSNEFAFLLSDTYDMVVNEEAFINGNIDNYWPFLHRNKPVLNTEYFTSRCFYCATAKAMGVSTIKKRPDLDSCMVDCTMDIPLSVTSVCDDIGFHTAGKAKFPANADGWCPMTENTDIAECANTRFGECEPSYGY
ncbi:hypothetical protein SARC_08746 [Sphaeroforma arctica JP610]|uniref:EGF-like domain-containing protein n=1 Tax=Sphaeroforma arctica JP610 TaxID=667725 RepID=A0A0L0FQ33_9EUKA|nr:hypothetical protein SARC_08746 [Sphaeroforma arctica JP610]KNC78829.1 hypothetical protein SARC_08746 [Sphaeroforma arctica JP610]|eukprot:XP_014152731.1 hypothetical protein SARC_08746 [Sphaeroforma arctica JP610]